MIWFLRYLWKFTKCIINVLIQYILPQFISALLLVAIDPNTLEYWRGNEPAFFKCQEYIYTRMCTHTHATYLLIQLCLLLNSSLCSQQKQRGLDPRANMWKREDEIVAGCRLQLAQVAVAICQVAGGTVWDWDCYWLLGALLAASVAGAAATLHVC